MYAVFKEDIQVSKEYDHIEQAIVHVYEQGYMYYARGKVFMCPDVTIKEIEDGK